MHQFTDTSPAGFPPAWWSTKGQKMTVDGVVLKKGTPPLVNIHNGTAAQVHITQNGAVKNSFSVGYNIDHGCSRSSGSVLMNSNELASAFGLYNACSDDTAAFGELGYRLNAAVQGKFVRKGNYLNIPHPSIGMQGDPNVSIQITDEMKSAIRSLLEFTAAKAA